MVQLKAFDKFSNTADALTAATALVESKLSKSLRKFIKAQCSGDILAVADSKLGNIIKEKLVSAEEEEQGSDRRNCLGLGLRDAD